MKLLFVNIVLIFFTTAVIAGNWTSGGSLHKSNVGKWRSASESNKLATAADWALVSPAVKKAVKITNDIDQLKPLAKRLVSCVDIISAELPSKQKISSVGALCMKNMKLIK
jgi:hypothetical protein